MSSGASAVASLGGAFADASALQAQGRYEDSIGRTNAALARGQANEAMALGAEDANRVAQGVRGLQGAQRAAAVSQGLVAGSGSAGELEAEAAKLGALDALTLRNNAARQAFGYDVQANEAARQGKFAKRMGKTQARTTLATGGIRFVRDMAVGGYLAKKAEPGAKYDWRKDLKY